MRACGKVLTIIGGLGAVIGLNNVFGGWQIDDSSYNAFLLIFNGLLLVLPGGAVATIGVALRRASARAKPARATLRPRMPAAGVPPASK